MCAAVALLQGDLGTLEKVSLETSQPYLKHILSITKPKTNVPLFLFLLFDPSSQEKHHQHQFTSPKSFLSSQKRS